MRRRTTPRRIAVIGGGVSGPGAAWALHQHPDRFDFRLFEAHGQVGGNANTADMPQDDGSSLPFDISETACIASVYHHIVLLMGKFSIEGQGRFLRYHCLTMYVKVALFRGRSLRPLPPVESKQKDVRYFHIHEDGQLDEEFVASWIRQASELPGVLS